MNFTKIREWLKLRLSEEKYLHSLGAEKTARELAERFSEDVEKAALAGLIHDNAKDISYEEMLSIIKENNFDIGEDIKNNQKILHAHLGSFLAEKDLDVKDKEVLDAIKFHTTGKPGMSLFEKIIFLADKIEANTRNLEFREEVLNILEETENIDKAVLFCVERTIKSLLDRKLFINSITIDVWNSYITTGKI